MNVFIYLYIYSLKDNLPNNVYIKSIKPHLKNIQMR